MGNKRCPWKLTVLSLNDVTKMKLLFNLISEQPLIALIQTAFKKLQLYISTTFKSSADIKNDSNKTRS